MSALPDHEDKKLYTEDEVQHIVARRMVAKQLESLEAGQIALRKEVLSEIADIKASIKELMEAWTTAGGVVRIVKYVAAFATSMLVLYTLGKEWVHR